MKQTDLLSFLLLSLCLIGCKPKTNPNLPIADQYIANGTWKLVYSRSEHKWALKQMKESMDGYSYYLGCMNYSDPLHNPTDIGIVSPDQYRYATIILGDTAYLKFCLTLYLQVAIDKNKYDFK